jgi:hypothetical protein
MIVLKISRGLWDIVATVEVKEEPSRQKPSCSPKEGDVIKLFSCSQSPAPPQLIERGRDSAAVNHSLEPINSSFARQNAITKPLPRAVQPSTEPIA